MCLLIHVKEHTKRIICSNRLSQESVTVCVGDLYLIYSNQQEAILLQQCAQSCQGLTAQSFHPQTSQKQRAPCQLHLLH